MVEMDTYYLCELESPIARYILSQSNLVHGFENLYRGLCIQESRIYSRFSVQDTIYRMKQNYKVTVCEETRTISVTVLGSEALRERQA